MKLFRVILLAIIFFPQLVFAYYNPGSPSGFVNDFAKILDPAVVAQLEGNLVKFQAETKHEIAVVTISSLQGDTIENYAVKLFEEWKMGKAGADNGVLFLIALEERKMRIEVGYGLEGALPDAIANKIINNITKPAFKTGDYNKGIAKSIAAIEGAIEGEDLNNRIKNTSTRNFNIENFLDQFGFLIFAGIFIVCKFILYTFGNSKKWWPGGIWGGVFGLIAGLFIIGLAINLLLWVLGFGGIGLLLDFFASKKGPFNKKHGGRNNFWFGGFGGGGFGGGGFGGGGFGGGGFGGGGSGGGGSGGGGSGGGGSGGGGSSGSW